MKKLKEINKILESKIEHSKVNDALMSSFKVLLSLTVVGSPLAALISEFIPSQRFLRLEKFVEQLASDLKKFEDSVKLEYIHTDEFALIFEQSIRGVIENYHQEKLDAFKWIVINSLIDNDLIQEEKEFFINLTKQLTITHIKILKCFSNPGEYLTSMSLTPNDIKGNWKNFLPSIFPNVGFDLIKTAFDDLNTYGLITMSSSDFMVMTISSGYSKLEGAAKLTDFGDKYYQFITENDINTAGNKPAASNAGGFLRQVFIKPINNRGKVNIKQVNPALAAAGRTL